MAGVPDTVLNWLYSVLPGQYADVNRTYTDVAEALTHYPSLAPRTKVFTYENGTSALLLRLGGTIPVSFRGTIYGFPIEVWIPHAYPREAPMIFVTPSEDMVVRPGQHISGDGRVYHPYLAQWGQYWDKSTLFDFFAVLRGVFAKEPPVRSKQQGRFETPATSVPPPLPPAPVAWRQSMQNTRNSPSSPAPASQGPEPPPKPPKPGEQSQSAPSPQPPHDRYSQPAPLPPDCQQSVVLGSIDHQLRNQQPNEHNTNGNVWQQHFQEPHIKPQPTNLARGQIPLPMTTTHRQTSQTLDSPVSPVTPINFQSSHYQHIAQHHPQPRAPEYHGYGPHAPQHQSSLQQQYTTPTSQSHHPRPYQQQAPSQQWQQPPPHQQRPRPQAAAPPPNLMDTDSLSVTLPSQSPSHQHQHVAPPIPPNPQKDALLHALSATLSAQTQTIATHNHNAIAPLLAQQTALQSALATLSSELAQLQSLDGALASNETVLREAMREADRVMQDSQRRRIPDMDDVLVAPTVVGGQLWNVVSEERALGEAIFVLGGAVGKGRVGCDIFIKQTRSLAREQFLKKALIKKIAKGMGLSDYGMR